MSFFVEKRGEFPTFSYNLIWHGGTVRAQWLNLKRMGIPSRNMDRSVPPIEAFLYSERQWTQQIGYSKSSWYWRLWFLLFVSKCNPLSYSVKHATMWETHELIAILLALINSLSLISTWQGTEVIMICCITVQDLCFWNVGRKNACFVSVCQVSIVFEVYSCCWLHWYRIKQYIALDCITYFYIHDMTTWGAIFVSWIMNLHVWLVTWALEFFATCQAIWKSWRWKPKNEGRLDEEW